MARRELTCPACAQTTSTNRAPGQQETCQRCGAEFRLPWDKPPGREVACPRCDALQTTGAAPGRKTRCKSCGERFRVPMREAGRARPLTCGCGAEFESSAPPGQRTRCPSCGRATRVPLELGESRARETRPCPHCGRETPRSDPLCQVCFLRIPSLGQALQTKAQRARLETALAVGLLGAVVLAARTLREGPYRVVLLAVIASALAWTWWSARRED